MHFQSPPFWCLMTTQEFAILQMDIMIIPRYSLQNLDGLPVKVRTIERGLPLDFTNYTTRARYKDVAQEK